MTAAFMTAGSGIGSDGGGGNGSYMRTLVDPSDQVPDIFPEEMRIFLSKSKILQNLPTFDPAEHSWIFFRCCWELFMLNMGLHECLWVAKMLLYMSMTGEATMRVEIYYPLDHPYVSMVYATYYQSTFWSIEERANADNVYRSYKQDPEQPASAYASTLFTLYRAAGHTEAAHEGCS